MATPLSEFETSGRKPASKAVGHHSRKWHPAATCIATGMTTKQTAEACGVSVGTLQHWRRNAKFQAFVNRLHDEAIEQAIGKLAESMTKAAEVVVALLDNPDADIRLKATDRVKDWIKHFRNDAMVLRKLEQLEAKLPVAVVQGVAN